jgi:hypothetical protein
LFFENRPLNVICHNLNVGFVIKCGVKGPMKPRKCVWMWNTLSQMVENARDGVQQLPNALRLWELHSCESLECLKPWLEKQTSTKLGPYDTIGKVLKFECLKCPHIVRWDLICMNYDKKKGRKWNWEFNYRQQISLKQRTNDLWLRRAIHHWKEFFEGYKILPLHDIKRLDLKKILVKTHYRGAQKCCHIVLFYNGVHVWTSTMVKLKHIFFQNSCIIL